VKSINWTNK